MRPKITLTSSSNSNSLSASKSKQPNRIKMEFNLPEIKEKIFKNYSKLNQFKNENIESQNSKLKQIMFKNSPSQKSKKNLMKMKTSYLIKNRQKKIEKLKCYRPIMSRTKRRKIIKVYPMIKRISKCNSKIELIRIFTSLTKKWKKLIKKYMERCFLIHLHLRQIKDFSELMFHRQNIYDALEDPIILESRVNFANNLVKNFCKGLTNYIVMFFDELIETGFIDKKDLNPSCKKNNFICDLKLNKS